MTKHIPGTRTIPVIRYRDAHAAIDFLERAFGLQRKLVVPGEAGQPEGTVVHATLTLGTHMIMLASHKTHGEFDNYMKLPKEAGGSTQAIYVVLDEVDNHYKRAVAAGADIIASLSDWDHGGRGYSCRDCEGHVWSFGTYDPWTADHSAENTR
jgi:uncharacterized glyoxalase superfamily protein PhnB